jgi:fermentation-respiration switch protein FrsA (DUF1100 family)
MLLYSGKYISLGYHEKKDVKAVIGFLRGNGIASKIGLWGRSMGAATALLFHEVQEEGEDITTLILDSPFSSLKLLSREIVANAKVTYYFFFFFFFFFSPLLHLATIIGKPDIRCHSSTFSSSC